MRKPDLDKWLLAPYEEAVERGHRFDEIKEHYTSEAEKDCTAAVYAASEERVTRVLTNIGNEARRLRNTGDTDEKLALTDWVLLRIDLIINEHAKAQAERDIERGDDTTKDQSVDDILATDCPECGHPGRGLSTCEHCGCFIGMNLALSNKKDKK